MNNVVLPSQYPSLASWPTRDFAGRRLEDPNRRLVLAVIDRAMQDAGKSAPVPVGNGPRSGPGWDSYHVRRRRSDRLEARFWLESASQEPWSFRWCCQVLGYEPPSQVRVKVKQDLPHNS